MKKIGLRMKTIRENMNLTPKAVSSYLNIPTEDLLSMESGEKNITLSVLNKLCPLYGCDESYLLCRSDDYDYTNFTVESDDVEDIASMNRIYMNMKYMIKKMN